MPRLSELDATFLKLLPNGNKRIVGSLAEADGLMHVCPVCFVKNGGLAGAHSVIEWFRGKVPDTEFPGPGRWTPQGTGLEDLTFMPGDPPMACSVQLLGGSCGWHGYIRNGEATLG